MMHNAPGSHARVRLLQDSGVSRGTYGEAE